MIIKYGTTKNNVCKFKHVISIFPTSLYDNINAHVIQSRHLIRLIITIKIHCYIPSFEFKSERTLYINKPFATQHR